VGAVDRHVGLDEEAHLAVVRAGDRLQPGPEQAVMDQQEIDARLRRLADDRLAGIHRRADARDAAGVGELEAVFGPREVARLRGGQELVEK